MARRGGGTILATAIGWAFVLGGVALAAEDGSAVEQLNSPAGTAVPKPPARPLGLSETRKGGSAGLRPGADPRLRSPALGATETRRASASRNDPDLETPADVGRLDRPGTFGHRPVRIPGPFSGRKALAAPSAPDLQMGVADKTTLGVFGDANRIERTDVRNSTTKPVTDVGAGVTLQYRFGQ